MVLAERPRRPAAACHGRRRGARSRRQRLRFSARPTSRTIGRASPGSRRRADAARGRLITHRRRRPGGERRERRPGHGRGRRLPLHVGGPGSGADPATPRRPRADDACPDARLVLHRRRRPPAPIPRRQLRRAPRSVPFSTGHDEPAPPCRRCGPKLSDAATGARPTAHPEVSPEPYRALRTEGADACTRPMCSRDAPSGASGVCTDRPRARRHASAAPLPERRGADPTTCDSRHTSSYRGRDDHDLGNSRRGRAGR